MSDQLRNMMAEMESWESAAEFGIPEDLWAGYQVRLRSDDLYIAALSSIFDTLRITDLSLKNKNLSDLAKTLLIYSRSAAEKYLSGIEKSINLLYCSAAFYLAGFPATATLVAKQINNLEVLTDEEKFLRGFLSRNIDATNELGAAFFSGIRLSDPKGLSYVIMSIRERERNGLNSDPRLFIASKLAGDSLEKFQQFNIWRCLRENAANFSDDLWSPFLVNANAFPLWELFPSQMTAIQSGILGDINETYSLQMPTSAGKTSLCEILIFHEVKGRGKKVLFLVPFRALASEIKEGISARLENAGVTVVASHGGNLPTRSESATAETADVLIITPEKFMALTQNLPELENSFDTIICDEGHLIDDSSRGLQYEILLTKLRSSDIRERKIIFISAILPNVSGIHEWLGGKPENLSKSEYKPVETDFAFIAKQDSNSWKLDFNTIYARPRGYFLLSFLNADDFRYTNPSTGRQKLVGNRNSVTALACAAALKARRNGSVALFTTQKGKNGVAGLANKMHELCSLHANVTLNSPPLSNALDDLIEYTNFQFGSGYSLSQILKYGIGFHHGDLPQEIRREMEMAIQNNVISILICTSTLAEGVNLPIRTLVMHTIKRFDGTIMRTIEKRSIKNIIGRVGRAGKETRGRIIFANNDERNEAEKVFRDLEMEPAYGALFQLVSSINQVVIEHNIQLNNEIFEAQDSSFLSILDKIDTALIDLIPPQLVIEQVEQYVEALLERTLAYKYCETDTLRDRIKEVFIIRAKHLQVTIPRESWGALRRSGSSPRFWQFVRSQGLLQRPEWQILIDPYSDIWLKEVVFKLLEMPTIGIDASVEILREAIHGWMGGLSYREIALKCNISIDDALQLLGHTIGFKLQDGLAKLSQLSIIEFGDANLSEIARGWPALLQYGLGDMQQLDLFDRGASDRLGVWGISRYLKQYNIPLRNNELIIFLRINARGVEIFLQNDERVPHLSRVRICQELKLLP